jgi:hypothetical protein
VQYTIRSDALGDGATHASPIVKRVKVNTAASADLIAAVTGKSLRIIALALYGAASFTTLDLQDSGTSLTGVMTGALFVWPWNPHGWIQTTSGNKLNAVLGAAFQLSGVIDYIEV